MLGQTSAVVLAIGINDMQRRSNDEILVNFIKMVSLTPGHAPIIVSAVFPLALQATDELHNNSRIALLNSRLSSLADVNTRVYFTDPGTLMVDDEGFLREDLHDGDGIHLNSRGNSIWIESLHQTIIQAQSKHPISSIKPIH
ncbi:MAG: GDSL-type esterase/lipase family protein [Pirellulales bacterium]|nr:GDSL-type esterase/lipase family protein [Pirellulales bacterium]